MSTNPKRHHLVSRGYLKAWRPEGEKDRVRTRVLPAPEVKLLGLKKVCVKTYWLATKSADGTRDVTIEKDLSAVEDRAIPHLRKALEVGAVQANERGVVAYLLTSLTVRGTTLRAALRTMGIQVGEEYLRDNPGANVELVREHQERHATGDLALQLTFELLAPLHASWLASMHWALHRDADCRFITSDQPMVHVVDVLEGDVKTSPTPLLQLGSLDAIMIALSPSTLLVASWRAGADTTQDAPPGLVEWFTTRAAQQTDRHLVAPPDAEITVDNSMPFPRLALTHDKPRLEAAVKARTTTMDEADPAVVTFTQFIDGEYRQVTSEIPTHEEF